MSEDTESAPFPADEVMESEHGEVVVSPDLGRTIVLMAFLTYLEEHPATSVLADEFTDVLTALGCLAAVPIQVDHMVACSLGSARG